MGFDPWVLTSLFNFNASLWLIAGFIVLSVVVIVVVRLKLRIYKRAIRLVMLVAIVAAGGVRGEDQHSPFGPIKSAWTETPTPIAYLLHPPHSPSSFDGLDFGPINGRSDKQTRHKAIVLNAMQYGQEFGRRPTPLHLSANGQLVHHSHLHSARDAAVNAVLPTEPNFEKISVIALNTLEKMAQAELDNMQELLERTIFELKEKLPLTNGDEAKDLRKRIKRLQRQLRETKVTRFTDNESQTEQLTRADDESQTEQHMQDASSQTRGKWVRNGYRRYLFDSLRIARRENAQVDEVHARRIAKVKAEQDAAGRHPEANNGEQVADQQARKLQSQEKKRNRALQLKMSAEIRQNCAQDGLRRNSPKALSPPVQARRAPIRGPSGFRRHEHQDQGVNRRSPHLFKAGPAHHRSPHLFSNAGFAHHRSPHPFFKAGSAHRRSFRSFKAGSAHRRSPHTFIAGSALHLSAANAVVVVPRHPYVRGPVTPPGSPHDLDDKQGGNPPRRISAPGLS